MPEIDDQAPEAVEDDLDTLISNSFETGEGGDEAEAQASPDVAEESDENDQSEQDEPTKVEPQPIKVKLKNEEGEEVEEEFDHETLAASIMMHRDYTRKTQELAQQSREAAQIVQQRVAQANEQSQAFVADHLQMVEAALGVLTGDRLDQLKSHDLGAWAEAIDRRSTLEGVRKQLSEARSALQKQQAEMVEQQKREIAHRTWQTLEAEKVSRQEVEKAFAEHKKYYGRLGEISYDQILDPVSVLTIRDAVAYRKLQEQGAKTTKQIQQQPKLPKAAPPTPQRERRSKALDQKFRSGSAKTQDLADWIAMHS